MLSLKQLYDIAKDELSDLLPPEECDFRLEQAEFSEKDQVWEIVVSFLTENKTKQTLVLSPFAGHLQFERVYKKIIIDQDKKVKGFYIYLPK